MKKLLSIILVAPLMTTIGCSVDGNNDSASLDENSLTLFDRLSNLSSTTDKRPQPPVWADCIEYSAIVVPANFKPESDPFDELYMMPGPDDSPPYPFKDDLPLISDSKPGDQDYNGGRWHLNVLKAAVDPAIYANACQEEDIDPANFDSTDVYFGCPLRPVNN